MSTDPDPDADAENTVAVCPECDHAAVTLVSSGGVQGTEDSKGRYECGDCGARFDAVAYREREYGDGAPKSGSARALLEADPDDWP
jgi:DNA-directed RNA polymerase subunit RPC12/RpoP